MKKSLLALSLLAALPFAASAAEGISYNYVESGYVATNLDNGNDEIDADGWGVNASVALHPNFHFFAGVNGQQSDNFGFLGARGETDVNQWRAGVGYNVAIAPKADLVARVAYEKFEVDDVTVNGQTYDINQGDDGYSAEVGVRSALASNFEAHASAGYEDFGDGADDFYGRVGAQIKFNPTWGVSGDVKFADGDTQYFVGPRLTW
ncbi:MAG: outer membrane beta-barrel protein [Lysobacter sp.]|nr:outer membrane beta-barrel protein [Lysobacter sp.]